MPERRPYVLVIEDDDDILEALELFFDNEGIAWRASRGEFDPAEPPSIAILDLSLGVDGGPVDRLKAAGVPIVVSSASSDARQVATRLGAARCLEKPFELAKLIEIIRSLAPGVFAGGEK